MDLGSALDFYLLENLERDAGSPPHLIDRYPEYRPRWEQ